MARHTITERELNEWLCKPQWQQFAASFGTESNKSFEVDMTEDGERVYRVIDHGETIFLGCNKAAAIEHYNSAR